MNRISFLGKRMAIQTNVKKIRMGMEPLVNTPIVPGKSPKKEKRAAAGLISQGLTVHAVQSRANSVELPWSISVSQRNGNLAALAFLIPSIHSLPWAILATGTTAG